MTNANSIAAFNALVQSGVLKGRRLEVAQFVLDNQDSAKYGGGISRGDVARHFNDLNTSFGPRLSELAAMKVVYAAGNKTDPVSGMDGAFYRITSCENVVTIPSKAKGELAQLREENERLKKENVTLQMELEAWKHSNQLKQRQLEQWAEENPQRMLF